MNLEIFLFAQNSIGNYFELNLKFRNAPNASRLSEQIKLFEVKKKKNSVLPLFATLIFTSQKPLVAKRSKAVELSLNTLEILRGKT